MCTAPIPRLIASDPNYSNLTNICISKFDSSKRTPSKQLYTLLAKKQMYSSCWIDCCELAFVIMSIADQVWHRHRSSEFRHEGLSANTEATLQPILEGWQKIKGLHLDLSSNLWLWLYNAMCGLNHNDLHTKHWTNNLRIIISIQLTWLPATWKLHGCIK